MPKAKAVSAKIVCQSKMESGEGDDRTVTVTFVPDYADGRNKEWARWTPGLGLTMGLKGAVADHFELQGKYTMILEETED